MIIVVGVGILLLLMILAVPIGFALGIAGIINLLMLVPTSTVEALMTRVVHGTTASNLFLAIPMFVLMAEFLSCGGVAEDLLLACNRLLRRVRGGLAMACILAGTVHAAATGSSTASAASLARASFPAMIKAGYAPSFSAGTIAIAGTLAVMVPPSIMFVLYGLMTGASIGKLFIAGIIPGVITALGYILTISVVLRLRPDLGPNFRKEAMVAEAQGSGRPTAGRGNLWPMVALVVVILGGLYAGVATPTEVSAIGASGALLISLQSGRMTRAGFLEAIGGTLRITSMIIVIVLGANLFGYFISFSKFTDSVLAWVSASGMSPGMVIVLVVFVYLLLGAFMDQAAVIILTAPVSTALVVGLGYDPIWWGVIMIKAVEIGLVTPPLGLVAFVVSATTRTPLKSTFVGVTPYIVTELIILALLVSFPQLSLLLVD